MLWLKSCPKCRGDLQQRNDQYGSYVACLQCGREFGEGEVIQLEPLWKRQTIDQPSLRVHGAKAA